MNTLERNRQAFSDQSAGFSSEGDTYADAEGLAWMLEALPLLPAAACLDIATGTGEFARALRRKGHDELEKACEAGRNGQNNDETGTHPADTIAGALEQSTTGRGLPALGSDPELGQIRAFP